MTNLTHSRRQFELQQCLIRSAFIFFIALNGSLSNAFELGDFVNKDTLGKLSNALPTHEDTTKPPIVQQPSTESVSSASLAAFSNKDQIASLKQVLTQGAETAVAMLAKENGFQGNDKVRISLPESLQKIDGLLRKVGMGRYGDELTLSMNRAAEMAIPEARNLWVSAVKKMTVEDAKSILTGNNDAATQYFRKNTESALGEKFRPIVNESMQKVQLSEKYDQFAGKGAKLGLIDQRDANLEDYIIRKAMDGLFLMMAEQEKIIRANPVEATGSLARKVFSAIRL